MRGGRDEARTYRLLTRVGKGVRVGVDGLSLDLVRPSSVVTETARRETDVALGQHDRLAIVERLDSSKGLKVLLNQVCQLVEILPALLRSDLAPLALEGLASGSDGNVNIFLGRFVNRGNDFLGAIVFVLFSCFRSTDWLV
jgi:hypothetical protein